MSERRKFRDYEKETVYKMYNGKCAFCGCPISRSKMTISHKLPLSRGGTNGFDNLQLACWTCNHMIGNLTFGEFVQKITEIWSYNNLPCMENREIMI